LPLAAGNGLFDGGVGLNLIRPQEGKVVGRGGEPGARGVEVAREQFLKRGGCVEGGDAA
jgi:hypothetical protein